MMSLPISQEYARKRRLRGAKRYMCIEPLLSPGEVVVPHHSATPSLRTRGPIGSLTGHDDAVIGILGLTAPLANGGKPQCAGGKAFRHSRLPWRSSGASPTPRCATEAKVLATNVLATVRGNV